MDEGETDSVEGTYLRIFEAHVDFVAEHIQGIDTIRGSFAPSYFKPCSYWTSEEKETFFHALTLHSRLRPDLIAEELPNKTVLDVCTYLELLEEASTNDPSPLQPIPCEAAHEVSDAWIEQEEKWALNLAENELGWDQANLKKVRIEELRSAARAARESLNPDQGGSAAIAQLKEQFKLSWRRADYLEDLSSEHLKAIDAIFRELEEPSVPAPSPQQPSQIPTSATLIPDSLIDPELLALSGRSSPVTETAHHQMDPQQYSSIPQALYPDIIQCETREPPPNQLALNVDSNDSYAPGADETGIDISALSPRSRRRHQKRMYMRRKRAERSGASVSTKAARLKPGRKTNKKLLKRKRAEGEDPTSNNTETPSPVLDLNTAKYTIEADDDEEVYEFGGKEELGAPDLIVVNPTPDSGEQVEQIHEDTTITDSQQLHRNAGGKTLPYRIKSELNELGYDAAALEEFGLGLFHLAGLSRLMSLQVNLHGVNERVTSNVSATTISLIESLVIQFVTDIMHRTIIIREHERNSKGHTKVWGKSSNKIHVNNIYDALNMVRAPKNKKSHFERLLSSKPLRVSSQTPNSSNAHETESSEDDPDEEHPPPNEELDEPVSPIDEEVNSTPLISKTLYNLDVHTELYDPLIWHPSYLSSFPHLFQATCSGHTALSDSLMEEETDEEKLEAELSLDADLDQQDQEASKNFEERLWAKVNNPKRTTNPNDVQGIEQPDPTQESMKAMSAKGKSAEVAMAKMRFASSGPSGTFKSSVFVEDSD